ncbi:beta-1,3-galactosyltransferase 5 [Aethina tumida]|uniref:beta-1,3-galactosyltransferase 5 n=1 Tax=Aethina tumida TaxID=116153 RepID=UPI00096B0234|nr:beta-1,3-galactosyltransferase 5 [Aethina tumida]XP_019872542.1 beta-1,3-galactosyltransferase 5 [Aethina tumida]XP_019872543.1 beta-1,3-galactosyltransferase 5 [Aethina tumida]XP_019872544.1 beta-1,3-galactosyltransferase 5 [Aethina tumida]
MGLAWPVQVRFLHLAIIVLALLTLAIFLSYTNTSQLHTTATPTRSLMTLERFLRTNATAAQPEQAALKNDASPHSATPEDPIVQPVVTSNHSASGNGSQPDLTRGVPAELIYQAGHVDMSQQVCPELGKNIKLLICITSAPSHESARLAIRETWGHYAIRKDVAIAFMLGSTSDETLNTRLDAEQDLYGDIIRGKFIDTYDNLTLKTISLLEWVDNYCPKAAFVLKTDDDMFINVSRLLAFLSKHKPDQRAIYGRLAKKWKPIRNKKSKYYISPQQYKPSVFPDFTTGPAYLMPAQLSKELYTAALNHTYFKLEDVFVTGIVANGLKIKRVHAPEFLNKKVSFTPCNLQKAISFHMVKSSEQYDLWKRLHEVAKFCKT